MNYYRKQRNYGCRFHDQYTYFGMRTLVLENERIRVSLLIDKGTEIFEFLYKPKDLDFMWLSENGVQNPNRYLSTSADPIASFIDYYPGGWQEIFPNGGPTSSYMNAQFGQHGEVAHMPWDYELIEDNPECVSILCQVRTKKVPFLLRKQITIRQGSATLEIEEELENLSEVPLQYMWGQHLAYGKPFLLPGSTINLPQGLTILTDPINVQNETGRVKKGERYAWPWASNWRGETMDLSTVPEKGAPSDILYVTGFDQEGWYEIENRQLSMGFRVNWDSAAFPYLWYWQEFGQTKSYPWYGRHYNIGLEPFSSYPTHGLQEALKNGSAASVGPRQRKKAFLKATPYELT